MNTPTKTQSDGYTNTIALLSRQRNAAVFVSVDGKSPADALQVMESILIAAAKQQCWSEITTPKKEGGGLGYFALWIKGLEDIYPTAKETSPITRAEKTLELLLTLIPKNVPGSKARVFLGQEVFRDIASYALTSLFASHPHSKDFEKLWIQFLQLSNTDFHLDQEHYTKIMREIIASQWSHGIHVYQAYCLLEGLQRSNISLREYSFGEAVAKRLWQCIAENRYDATAFIDWIRILRPLSNYTSRYRTSSFMAQHANKLCQKAVEQTCAFLQEAEALLNFIKSLGLPFYDDNITIEFVEEDLAAIRLIVIPITPGYSRRSSEDLFGQQVTIEGISAELCEKIRGWKTEHRMIGKIPLSIRAYLSDPSPAISNPKEEEFVLNIAVD